MLVSIFRPREFNAQLAKSLSARADEKTNSIFICAEANS